MVRLFSVVLILLSMAFSAQAIGASQEDQRLTQRVTYSAKRKTISAILTDLSAKTGVTFKAGMSNLDWQVRDRKMNVFVKDLPLSNLMNSIARVMKFKWSKKSDDGAIAYRLYADSDAILAMEKARLAKEEQLRNHVLEGRQKLADDLDRASKLSEDDLEDLKTDSPYLYQLMKTGTGKVLSHVLSEIPQARQAWLHGREIALDKELLSSEQQQQIWDALAIKNAFILPDGKDVPYSAAISLPGIPNEWGSCPVSNRIGSALSTVTVGEGQSGHGQSIAVTYSSLWDPDCEEAKLWTALEQSTDESQTDELQQKLNRAIAADVVELGESVTEHTDDPSLSVKMKLKVQNDEYSSLFQALAESACLSIVSDSLDVHCSDSSIAATETSLSSKLAKLEQNCRYRWEKRGFTLELHDRDWLRKRSIQIPEARLEKWRKDFKRKGLLDLENLSEIASLTTEQYSFNLTSDDFLASDKLNEVMWQSRRILSIYASLSKDQRAAVFSEDGLLIDKAISGKLFWMQSPLANTEVSLPLQFDGFHLVGKREHQEKEVSYSFKITTSSGDPTGMQWTVICPVYTPPVEEKQETK